ncbi:MAG: hypothetical protein US62_C0001G0029 [Candidatus Woesebacteria bacterium GW2011_GWA1_37_8]|uniref:Phage shock protein C, PspC n=2 Tax=Candidatus Woeseibacteriota TaxID=1752722 RepID=A0A0G0PES4_9BACT|nr:MAG: hypothetical protein US62_C0001G0029 [Candidatus Woesebacteria bacterium GW2011_GWA1_37_8]KKQ87786.1 MAG: hypothetical protein UT10_C0001G0027 [Candidatus Woesebacteria bacterium GW2011_GWB1_38_8b]
MAAKINKSKTTKLVSKKTESASSPSYKKLFRPKKGRLLGGVCLGLAEFLDFDPMVVRLIFVVVTLLGGSGVLIYFILWLIIPSEDHPGEITSENLKISTDEMKDKANEFKENAKLYSQKTNPKTAVGVILIILGVFFLIQNLGLFHFNFIWRFWPIILIAFAIYLIGKND